MKTIMLASMHSNAGKTVLTTALLTALKRQGLQVRAFKCGPDYIDPMFHSRVLGVPSGNLDLFLQGRAGLMQTLAACRGDLAVLEGAMGFYDGITGTTRASAWEIAWITKTPVVLVLRPAGSSLTLAAQVKGILHFRDENYIAGLLLTDCRESLYSYLKPLLERETGLPVLGYLPPLPEAQFESRSLGLLRPEEIPGFTQRFNRIASYMEKTVDLSHLSELAAELPPVNTPEPVFSSPRCRIAVARDEAFCFYYEENFTRLRLAGAEIVFFSPLQDTALPDKIDGLYLGGGYPEHYAAGLAANTQLRESLQKQISSGLPTVAECGGFLYLQQQLADESGQYFPMCGVLPGKGFPAGHLVRFGYQTLKAETDSLLFRAGETIPAHEFHHWESTENGSDLLACKADGRSWPCGYAWKTLYAGFPHLHFGGMLPLAERFVIACLQRKNHGPENTFREHT